MERKERRKGREVNKVPCSLPSRGILISCQGQEETRVKRVPVAATGSGPLVGKLVPEYPKWSGCQSQQSPRQSRHLLQEGGPLPGPETRLLSNTRK